MNNFWRLLTLFGLSFGIVGCGPDLAEPDTDSAEVLHLSSTGSIAQTVNGIAVPQSLVEAVAKGRGLDLEQPAQREQAHDEVAQYVLLAEQAKKLNLAQQPDLAALIEAARLQGAANAAVVAYERSHPVTDAMVAADYQRQLEQTGNKTYRFTQLLFADPAMAKAAAADLKGGTPYSEVFDRYRAKARDARSYPNVFPKQLPPPLAAALVALEPGEATTVPVQSRMGWHVIYLDGVNPFQAPALEAVAEQVRANLVQKQAQAYIETLTKAATITIVDPANTSTAARPGQPAELHGALSPNVVHDVDPAATSTAVE